MDLFEYMRENFSEDDSPLAKRMRPTSLDDVVGQEHIIGKDKLLYRAIKADKISSLIFYGPPGTGKTTLAMVIANTTKAEFRQLNATTAGNPVHCLYEPFLLCDVRFLLLSCNRLCRHKAAILIINSDASKFILIRLI